MSDVYESLNKLSNNEFENIQITTHPIEHYLDTDITSNILMYKTKHNDNHYTRQDKTRSRGIH